MLEQQWLCHPAKMQKEKTFIQNSFEIRHLQFSGETSAFIATKSVSAT